MVTGIDLSEKNGPVDWEQLRRGELGFVYLRATEAIDLVDAMFDSNMERARKSGILAGAYHWLHPGLHVGQQTNLFVNKVKNFGGLLPPVVCLENHITNANEMEQNVLTFLRLIEQKVGVKPVIYTSENYWKTYFLNAIWGCDYLLWLDKPGSTWPGQLWPWAGWSFWQYSYQAKLPGVSTTLGMNWFNGSSAELGNMVVA